MPTKTPLQPVKPRGQATRQSEAQLSESTSGAVLQSQVDKAISDWKKNAPAQFRDILEARETV
jgi:hypothetical protein